MTRRRRHRTTERQVNVGLKAGTYVAWASSSGQAKGRVVSVHTAGKVPGVIAQHLATEAKPAARVQLYAKSGNGWEATTVYVAHPIGSLSTIDALPEPTVPAIESTYAAGSFDAIRSAVEDAIEDRLEAALGVEPSIYVCDIGYDWAVYSVNWGDDCYLVAYTVDAAGAVTLGEPVEVTKVITWVADTEPAEEPPPAAGTAEGEGAPAPMTESVRHEGRLLGSLGTDDTGCRVFEVQIIAYGDSKNGRRYPESVMRSAAALYNGAKAYDHHRTEAELMTGTTVGIVGDYRNVEATTTGLKGELHLLPSATHTAELLDRTLANQAAGLPPLIGISHDVMTAWKSATVAGRPGREVTAIMSVNSADVVADPAAGGAAMRMVANTDPTNPPTPTPTQGVQVNLKQLLALFRASESTKRPALLAEHASLIESFGFNADEFAREVENGAPAPAPTPATPAPDRTVEGYTPTSVAGRMMIQHVLGERKLESYTEAITKELGDKFTEADLEAAAARYARAAEAVAVNPTVPAPAAGGNVGVRFDTMDKKIGALDAFFAGNWKEGYRSFKEAYLDITGYRGTNVFDADFHRTILRESAGTQQGGFYDSTGRSLESVTSSTWSLILGDSITRRMVQEYARDDWSIWKQLVNTVPVSDFRTQRVDRMGDYAVLPTVNQGAPYQPLTTPGNEEATYAASKKGGTEDLTLETIANDDIRAILRIPQRLGIAAAETIYKFVLDFFIAPITATYDSVATFHSSHGNTDANALSDTNLSAGWVKMLKQSALNGTASFLPVNPRFLLVPPDLRQTALVLCTSPVAVPAAITGASNVPNVNQGLVPIIVPYWTATSTTAWYLLADPGRTPFVEVGLYQGKEDPDLFVQSDSSVGSMFDADKLTYKIRHIYGGTVVDHRGAYRGNS